jgi:phosphoserine aminotransferase
MRGLQCVGSIPRQFSTSLHAANAPSVASAPKKHFQELLEQPMAHTVERGRKRAINLSAGCAALPLEVLERAAAEFVDTDLTGTSVAEMGYRTKNLHDIVDRAEASLTKLLDIPDTHEIHFFNGGATLQFAAIPMNLMAGAGPKKANYLMSGHWSEKARNEAQMFGEVHQVANDPKGLYFSIPDSSTWDVAKDARYFHYTSADTRQGLEIRNFPYEAVPKEMPLVADLSANLGSYHIDISKYGVAYAAAHKNFSTAGVCYTIIRKDLLKDEQLPGTPTMCNWWKFHTAPNRIYNVPVITSVWLGNLVCEWMLAKGGIPYFEELAIRRSNILYEMIDSSGGFYNTFVTDPAYRSRMQVVFTIRDGSGDNIALVEKFLTEANDELGWLDIRSHPLGIPSDAIRVTMYNPQTEDTIRVVRDFMHDFQKRHM